MTIIRYPTERSVRSPSFIIQDGIVYSPYNRVIEDDVEIDLYRQLRTLQLRESIEARNNKALYERYKEGLSHSPVSIGAQLSDKRTRPISEKALTKREVARIARAAREATEKRLQT